MRIHLDMETSDPDDVFALGLLATHPRAQLTGVTIVPGGHDQVGLVRAVLDRLGRADVHVGADPRAAEKPAIGDYYKPFYDRWLGPIAPRTPHATDTDVLRANHGATLLTGAPLTNVWRHHQATDGPLFESWTCQGGFAGDNVVAAPDRLPKFAGKLTCPTFNLNKDSKAALGLLGSPRLGPISMVSKNVCHGFTFDRDRLAELPKGAHAGLDFVIDAMALFIAQADSAEPKALHDVLAAVLVLSPELARWVDGTPYRERGEWGFRGGASSTRIVTSIDREAVVAAMAS